MARASYLFQTRLICRLYAPLNASCFPSSFDILEKRGFWKWSPYLLLVQAWHWHLERSFLLSDLMSNIHFLFISFFHMSSLAAQHNSLRSCCVSVYQPIVHFLMHILFIFCMYMFDHANTAYMIVYELHCICCNINEQDLFLFPFFFWIHYLWSHFFQWEKKSIIYRTLRIGNAELWWNNFHSVLKCNITGYYSNQSCG